MVKPLLRNIFGKRLGWLVVWNPDFVDYYYQATLLKKSSKQTPNKLHPKPVILHYQLDLAQNDERSICIMFVPPPISSMKYYCFFVYLD